MQGKPEQDEPGQSLPEPACPICGECSWHVPPQTNNVLIALQDGRTLEAQPSICANCSFVRLHSRTTEV
jgi:hypothetical protein